MSKMQLTGHRCKCAACGKHFSRASVFDKHRTGPYTTRRCLTEAEMANAGMQISEGLWRGQAGIEFRFKQPPSVG